MSRARGGHGGRGPEGLRRAFELLDREVTDHVELRHSAAAALRRHLGFDVAVLATVDPTTVMWTHCVLEGMERDEHLEEQVFRNEYSACDVLTLSDLLHTPGHAGSLAPLVAERPGTSPRMDELWTPMGITDELRVLFVDGDSAWGALCLLRSGGTFSDEDLAAVAGLSAPFAATLRRSLLRAAIEQPSALDVPPGLIVCGPDGAIVDMNDDARRLVDLIGIGEVPQVVTALRARAAAGERAEAAMPTRSGHWLAFHATRMADRGAGNRDVVIVEQVRAHRLAELIVRSRGLTSRERDVVECVARGLSTRDIGEALFISEWTVQDHLKAVFAKFGVRSRSELVAAIFFEHYGPRHAAEDTPSPYGWYLDRPVPPAGP